MNDTTDGFDRLDRLEALNLAQREQLTSQGELLEALALDLARLERSVLVSHSELFAALSDLRSHLVDLSLDGYYPTRPPPKPFASPKR